jgi:uncharacterized protein YgbK (DUF1537 family)
MKLGIVADDVTGANDIGGMTAKANYLTHIYTFDQAGDYDSTQGTPDVCILNTNSRLDARHIAYDKVFAATKALQAAGYRQFHNKTCSVFRGNIGAEFDAMLDALGAEFAVVVLGFPKTGRTTRGGIHYVRGVKLEESEFRNDPIHPMTRSDLVGILQAQTERKVALITEDVVAKGSDALRTAVDVLRSSANYVILDVADQDALATIAQAVIDEPVLCGSSALAEELAKVWGVRDEVPDPPSLPYHPELGILCVAGSLMPQTTAQVQYLDSDGTYVLELDTLKVFNPKEREDEIHSTWYWSLELMHRRRYIVVQSPGDPGRVAATREAGSAAGLTPTEVARVVTNALAEVAARVLFTTGQNRLLVMGGETSAAVCDRLGIRGMRVWQEIEPGLPSCVSLTEPQYLLVLKSGSFGAPDFGVRAIEHLRAQR